MRLSAAALSLFFIAAISHADCLDDCNSSHAVCMDTSQLGAVSFSKLMDFISSQDLEAKTFFYTGMQNPPAIFNSSSLCSHPDCRASRSSCYSTAIGVEYEPCFKICARGGCDSALSCTVNMREAFIKCDSNFISCCQSSLAQPCQEKLIKCRQDCPPEIFTQTKVCANLCKTGDIQTPYPECLCIAPPSMWVCEQEEKASVLLKGSLQKTGAEGVSVQRGDSVSSDSGVSVLSFSGEGDNCTDPRIVLRPGAVVQLWDYSEKNDSKTQTILVSRGAARFISNDSSFTWSVKSDTGWFFVDSLSNDFAVENNGYTGSVKVFSGSVYVTVPSAVDAPLLVKDGEEAVLYAGAVPVKGGFAKNAEEARWVVKEKNTGSDSMVYAIVVLVMLLLVVLYFLFSRKKKSQTPEVPVFYGD